MNHDLEAFRAMLGRPGRQKDFAALVGISQAAASQWAASGLLAPGATLGEWVRAYCERLRQQAEQRLGDGTLDLVQERAALARAQRIGYEMRNEQALADYAPTELLRRVLAVARDGMTANIDQLPDRLAAAAPDLPPAAWAVVMTILASARAKWVNGTAELMQQNDQEEPDQEEAEA